jgi:hypothetical protein
MSDLTSLLPVPRHVVLQTDLYPLAAGRLIMLSSAAPQESWFSAGLIRRTLFGGGGPGLGSHGQLGDAA